MITFWFELASTYSYIAAERLRAQGEVPPKLRWRAFLLGPILNDMGVPTSPFLVYPIKGAYMWRDLERLAEREGLVFNKPEPFPQNGLIAARIATAFADAAWLPDFVCGVYRAQFVRGLDIRKRETLTTVLNELDLDTAAILEAADEPATKARLRDATDAARTAGIFGAPSFTVDDELFWGQDRLDDALAWARR